MWKYRRHMRLVKKNYILRDFNIIFSTRQRPNSPKDADRLDKRRQKWRARSIDEEDRSNGQDNQWKTQNEKSDTREVQNGSTGNISAQTKQWVPDCHSRNLNSSDSVDRDLESAVKYTREKRDSEKRIQSMRRSIRDYRDEKRSNESKQKRLVREKAETKAKLVTARNKMNKALEEERQAMKEA